LRFKIIEAPKKFKNQPRPLGRPSSVNFCQIFLNLSHETVPFTKLSPFIYHPTQHMLDYLWQLCYTCEQNFIIQRVVILKLKALVVTLLSLFNKNSSCDNASSVADLDPNPDPPDPHVFGPPGYRSRSITQRYGSGSFYNHAKIVRKMLIPTILVLFETFYLRKIMLMYLQEVISRKFFKSKFDYCWHLEAHWQK
jgi:hypothetical protein